MDELIEQIRKILKGVELRRAKRRIAKLEAALANLSSAARAQGVYRDDVGQALEAQIQAALRR